MRLLCLAGLPRLQSFASVLLCQGSCLADRSHTPSTYPLGTMADQTATVSRHCQQGFLGFPVLRELPRYFKRAWCRPWSCAPAPTPNRTCKFPSIRLSKWFCTHYTLACLSLWHRRQSVQMLSKLFAISRLAK